MTTITVGNKVSWTEQVMDPACIGSIRVTGTVEMAMNTQALVMVDQIDDDDLASRSMHRVGRQSYKNLSVLSVLSVGTATESQAPSSSPVVNDGTGPAILTPMMNLGPLPDEDGL